jgi:membrane fusion protein (multidrug efflux system)
MKARRYLIPFLMGGMLLGWIGCSGKMEENNIPVKIQVQKAESYDNKEAYAYSGTIEASETIPLSFNVTGAVLSVPVAEGDFVKKGQLLAVLNAATLKNVYEMSRAMLDKAEDAYKRLKPMYENGNLPEIKFVDVETGLQQAKAAEAIAQKNLDDCNLYASVDGFVGSRSIEPGMNVVPGFTAIKMVKIEKVYARISISESEIARIEKGQKASIMIGALGPEKYEGMVEEIGVMADPIAHTYKIKIGISNKDNTIKPGMICEARIQTSDAIDGVIIPNHAVQVDESGQTFVFGIDENKRIASRKYVETGRLMNDGIEIKSGLIKGELVVIAGQQKLVDNSSVQIIN